MKAKEKKIVQRSKNSLQWAGIHLHESFKYFEKQIDTSLVVGSHWKRKKKQKKKEEEAEENAQAINATN